MGGVDIIYGEIWRIRLTHLLSAQRLEVYQSIAQVFVKEPIKIQLAPSLSYHGEGWGGEAYWKGGTYVIEVLDRLNANTERDVFLHELGHIARGHVEKKDATPTTNLELIQQAWAVRGELAPQWQAQYDQQEQQANRFSIAIRAKLQELKLIW